MAFRISFFRCFSTERRESEVVLFLFFEVLVGSHLELSACIFITHDHGVAVELNGADGPHMTDRLLDGMFEGTRLIVATAENQH